jgi:transcriptional regulator with XRE-family HTH domain
MRKINRIDKIATAKLLQAAFRAQGVRQAAIADAVRLNQSQVSKILKGQFQRSSKGLNALCAYFKVKPAMEKQAISLSGYPELAGCLSEFLDGSRKRERAVVRLLRSAQKLA